MKDLYKVLGVGETAAEGDIKKAYRKLAKEHHPDATGGDAKKTERFKEVSDAYAVLGDAQKRGEYDRLRRAPVGADGMPQGFDPQNFADIFGDLGRGGNGRGRVHVSNDMGDMSDIFRNLFGGGGGGGRHAWADGSGMGRREPRGADLSARLEITLAESVLGSRRTIQTGSGKAVEVQIPAGVESGGRLRIARQGGAPQGGKGKPGDLYLDIVVLPHPHLRRDGDDIELDLPVTIGEALLGAAVDVPTVEGSVRVTIPAGTSSGRKLRLRGKGATRADGSRGDQLCRIQVMVPKLRAGDAEARRLVGELEKLSDAPPIRTF